MANISGFISRFLFQLRWVFMSQEKRYVYLWNRTESHYKY